MATALTMVAAMVSVFAVSASPQLLPPAQAAPGTPGTLGEPVVVFEERFENTSKPVSLIDYTGPAQWDGQTYSADRAWLSDAQACNGWILSFNDAGTPVPPLGVDNQCFQKQAWPQLRAMAWVLGKAQGMSDIDAQANHALSEYTNTVSMKQQEGTIIKSNTSIAKATAGRFYDVSAFFGAMNCEQFPEYAPKLTFSLLIDGKRTVLAKDLDPCTSTTPGFSPATKNDAEIWVKDLHSSAILVPTAANLGFQLENMTATGVGNDGAFDFPRILDVTPQLDQEIIPGVTSLNTTTTLTYTITNTREKQAKKGWSFSAQLPSWATVKGQATTTCAQGKASVDSSGAVKVSGDLRDGDLSCTVKIPVSVSAHGPHTLEPTGITAVTGLNRPGTATLNTTELVLAALAAPASVTATGEKVQYTFTVSNAGSATVKGLALTASGAFSTTSAPGFSGTGTLGAITCDTTEIAPGGSATCQAAYTATSADIDAKSIRLTAVATGKAQGASAAVVSNPASVTVEARRLPSAANSQLTLTPKTQTVGKNVTATVVVKDASGAVMPGVLVTLGAGGNATFGSLSDPRQATSHCTTNGSGQCSLPLTDTTAETIAVTAQITVGDTPVAVTGSGEKVTFTAGKPSVTPTCPQGQTGTNFSVDKAILPVGEISTATALVTDDYCNPVPNHTVTFSLDTGTSGVINPVTATTGLDGTAFAAVGDMVAETVKARAHITEGEIPSAQNITFTAGSFSHIRSQFEVSPVADLENPETWVSVSEGSAYYTGTLTAADAQGNKLSNLTAEDIRFSASSTDVAITGVVNNGDGTYTVRFSSKVASSATTAQVSYKDNQVGKGQPIPFVSGAADPKQSSVTVSDSRQTAGSPVTITVSVKDVYGNPVTGLSESGIRVNAALVSASGGTPSLVVSGFTEASPGVYTYSAVSKQVSEYEVTATVAGEPAMGNPHIVFIAGAVCVTDCEPVDPTHVTRVEVIQDRAEANGVARDVVKVYAYDENGNPVPGAVVGSTTTSGSLRVVAPIAPTGGDGTSTVDYYSTVSGPHPAKLTVDGRAPAKATSMDATVTLDGTVTVNFTSGKASAAHSSLSIDPSDSQEAGSAFTVTAHVKDVNGNPVSGATVTFPAVNNLSFNTTSCVSGVGGTCQVTVTSLIAGRYTVSAQVDDQRVPTTVDAVFHAGQVCVVENGCEPVGPGTDPSRQTRVEVTVNDQPVNGIDIVKVHAFDKAGNPVDGVRFEIRTKAPVTLGSEPNRGPSTTVTSGADGTATLNATSAVGGPHEARAFVNGTELTKHGSALELRFLNAPVITSPADEGLVNANPVTITGSGQTPGDTVVVADGSAEACRGTVKDDLTWSCQASLADGKHTLTAVEVTPGGNSSNSSAPVGVTVDTKAPGVPVIVKPATGSALNENKPVISGTAEEPGNTVTITDGGKTVCTAEVQKDGSFSCAPASPLDDGKHTLVATETDKAGNVSKPSSPVTVTIDTKAPGVPVIQRPADGSSTNDNKPAISGTAEEPGNTITVSDGGTVVCTASVQSDKSWSCAPTAALSDGKHSFVANEKDKAGNQSGGSKPVTVTIDTQAPGVPEILKPSGEATLTTGQPDISGTGKEPGDTVTVSDGGRQVCTAIVQPDKSWSCAPGSALGDGKHTLVAKETDAAGNTSGPSKPVEIMIDTKAPGAPEILKPSGERPINDNKPVISGTGEEAGNTLTVTDGDKVVCTGVVQEDGSWSCKPGSALNDGKHTFVATETDGAGNQSKPSKPVTVTIDSKAPSVPEILSPVSGSSTNQNKPVVTGTGEESGNTITVSEGNTVVCTATVQEDGSWSCAPGSALTDGQHTLAATETDASQNQSAASEPVTVTIDTRAPGIPEIVKPGNGSSVSDNKPEISGTSKEPGNTVTVTDGDKVVCTATVQKDGSWSCTPGSSLTDGEHSLVAKEKDKAGNESGPSKPVTVIVDTQAPGVPEILKPGNGASLNENKPVISGTGKEPGNTVTVTDGGSAVCTGVVQKDGSWSCAPDSPLADGEHKLVAAEKDTAGNQSGGSKPVGITIDTKAPGVPEILKPGSGGIVNENKPAISGTGEESGNTITVTDGDNSVCTATVQKDGSWSCTPGSSLTDGEHSLIAKEKDKSGNESGPSKPVTVVVDTQAPGVPEIVKPGDGSSLNENKPVISGTGKEPGNTVTVTDGDKSVCTAVIQKDGSWSCTPSSSLTDGEHSLVAKEKDKAGNESGPSKPVTVVVDTQTPAVPVIVKPGDGSSLNENKPVISGTSKEPGNTVTVTDGDTVICTAEVQKDGSWSCAPGSSLADGNHELVAKEKDKAGNESGPSKPVTVVVDTQTPAVPVIVKPGDGSSIKDNKPEISGTSKEPGNTVTVTDGDTVVCTAEVQKDGSWSCAPGSSLADGNHELVAKEKDKAGNESGPSKPVTVVVDTQAPGVPELLKPGDGSSIKDNKPEISGTSKEPGNTVTVTDGDTVVCTAEVQKDGSWSCTPGSSLTDGNHELVAKEKDKAGNESGPSKPVTVVVDTEAPSVPEVLKPGGEGPIGTGQPEISGTSKEPGNTVTVTDGDTVVCTAEVQKDGSWSCTPGSSLTDGNHELVAKEKDKAGNESDPSKPVVVVVDTEAPKVPGIVKPGNGSSINENKPEISGTGDETGNVVTVTDGGTVVCTAEVQKDGSWSCTPGSSLTDGNHELVAKEKDKAGNESGPSKPVTVVVDTEAPKVPGIVKPGNGSSINENKPEISGTGDEAGNVVTVTDGDTVVCTAEVQKDGSWSCAPGSSLTDGKHELVAKEKDKTGNESGPSKPVTVVVDTQAPGVPEVLKPGGEGPIGTGRPEISGTGEESGNTVTITDDGGTVVCTTTVQEDGSWSCTPGSSLTDGKHELVAKEKDKTGNESGPSKPVTVVVDTQAPGAPEVLKPGGDGPINENKPEISGTGEEPGNTVTVTDGGKTVCMATVQEDGSWTCSPDSPLTDGNHELVAKEKDKAGNESGDSKPVTVVVDTQAPGSPEILSPNGEGPVTSNRPGISGTGEEPGNTVTVTDGGTVVCTATVQEDGSWTCAPRTPLTDGEHSLTASETDKAGNQSNPSKPVTVVIDTREPVKPVVKTGGTAHPEVRTSGIPVLAMGLLLASAGIGILTRRSPAADRVPGSGARIQ